MVQEDLEPLGFEFCKVHDLGGFKKRWLGGNGDSLEAELSPTFDCPRVAQMILVGSLK